jgi:hypothetical protein
VLGLLLALLILRRIVDPPDLAFAVSSQAGVFVGLIGAICAAFGGLVDTSRVVVEQYPEMAFWRPSAGELGPGSEPPPRRAQAPTRSPDRGREQNSVIESTAEEI